MDDPIVEEVRHARRRILAERNGDMERLIARLKAAETKDKDRLVTVDDVRKRSQTGKPAT